MEVPGIQSAATCELCANHRTQLLRSPHRLNFEGTLGIEIAGLDYRSDFHKALINTVLWT